MWIARTANSHLGDVEWRNKSLSMPQRITAVTPWTSGTSPTVVVSIDIPTLINDQQSVRPGNSETT
jgi:hypothetical protein